MINLKSKKVGTIKCDLLSYKSFYCVHVYIMLLLIVYFVEMIYHFYIV